MSRVVGLFLLLLAAIWLVAWIDGPASDGQSPVIVSAWRRTETGWERSDNWLRSSDEFRGPASGSIELPHPALLALFEALAGSLCLLAFPAGKTQVADPNTKTACAAEFARMP